MLWRVQQQECAGRRVAEFQPTFSSGIWLWITVQADSRRLEVVVDGLLSSDAQLTIDTTLVSPLRGDGQPHRRCVDVDGAALDEARRRKERTYPELCERHSRARLVVLAAEVGGRWSDEAADFLKQLAKAKARGVPRVLQVRTRQAWQMRWSSLLACSSARAFALSLLDRRALVGVDGDTPSSSDVVGDIRHVPLSGFA